MSDSQEKSDDLIAELARLMASNAQGTESEAKPTVIKLAPLSEATVPPPAPIRIPGMEVPVAPAVPTVRIPGLEKPAGINEPAVAPQAKAQPVTPADVSKPAAAAPTIVPEPLASWRNRDAPKPAPVASGPVAIPRSMTAPAPQPTPAQPTVPQAEAKLSADMPRNGPTAAVASAPSPAPSEAKPAASARTDIGFDFASNGGGDKPEASPQKPVVPPAPEHDPIADLIAAELDAVQAEPANSQAPKTDAPKPAPVFSASVEVVPARNFGNANAGQAPIPVARPVAAAPRGIPTAPAAFRPLPPAAPQPAESDKFAIAPVFGLGGRPAPVAAAAVPPPLASTPIVQASPAPIASQPHTPKPDSDPMDEIENLIGEAVRVQLSASGQAAPAKPIPAPAAPVVPPLTVGFAPRRAGLKDNEPQVRSAEAAILAAAAATGAEVGRIIEPGTDDGGPYKRVKAKPEKANMFGGVRQYVGMAVAGTLLLAAGLGLYWVLGMGRGDATAPVLTADTSPAKQVPAVTAAEAAPPARSVVFDEIDGVAAVDSGETLVSRDETAGASIADVASVVAPKVTESTESGLANRKVRTVTVRPDGTIVSGDEAVAGTEALPVERPNVPEVPGAVTEPSDLLTAAAASNTDTTPPTDPAPLATATAELDPIAAAIAGETAEAAAPLEVAALVSTETVPAVFDASIVPPTPMPRPVDRTALNAGSAQVDTGATPAVTPRAPASTPLVALTDSAQVTTQSSGGAAAYVQLSSQRSESDARTSLRNAQSRWSGLFGGNSLEIQRADLGQKGVYYRVRLPASSLQDATQICASIKADGGDCFATNG